MPLHHQRIIQETSYRTSQEKVRKAAVLEADFRQKQKELSADGFYELAQMVDNFKMAVIDYRMAIAA